MGNTPLPLQSQAHSWHSINVYWVNDKFQVSQLQPGGFVRVWSQPQREMARSS